MIKPVNFECNDRKYQIKLGLDELAKIEIACDKTGLPDLVAQMQAGMLSVLINVAIICVRKETEVGYQAIELHEVGPLVKEGNAFASAIALAVEQLGNALGLVDQP
jgi:hypothetical protein